jgi:hypothetical protein
MIFQLPLSADLFLADLLIACLFLASLFLLVLFDFGSGGSGSLVDGMHALAFIHAKHKRRES